MMKKTQINKIIILITLTVIIIAGGILFGKRIENKHIFTVGQEKIYKNDLNKKISEIKSVSNQNNNINYEEIAKQRLSLESRILQKAADENRITLNSSFYNSKFKDISKRKKIINEILTNIKNDYSIEGEYVALWFVNIEVGPLGYQQAKTIAYNKINNLYQKVKNGQLTMEEAGNKIIEDESLKLVDTAYKKNAYKQFQSKSKEPITFNLKFNKIIKDTAVGQLTPIYVAKDRTEQLGEVEAVYIFAKVNKKRDKQTLTIYEWLNEAKQKYEIQNI